MPCAPWNKRQIAPVENWTFDPICVDGIMNTPKFTMNSLSDTSVGPLFPLSLRPCTTVSFIVHGIMELHQGHDRLVAIIEEDTIHHFDSRSMIS